MAKKIGNHNSLQFALAQLVDEPQHADEFSVDDFVEAAQKADPSMTLTIARNRLAQMFQNGQLKKRKIRRDGKTINLFRKD
jgi:hypothetical protein